MNPQLITELVEHVDEILGSIDKSHDEELTIAEELAHQLREELENLQE